MSANVLHGIFYGFVLLASVSVCSVKAQYPQTEPETGTGHAAGLATAASVGQRLNLSKYMGAEQWWSTNKSGPYDVGDASLSRLVPWGWYVGGAIDKVAPRTTHGNSVSTYVSTNYTVRTEYRKGNRSDYEELLSRKVQVAPYNDNPLGLSESVQESIRNGANLPSYMVRDFDGTWRTNSIRAQYATGKIRWRTVGAHQPTD